MRTGGSVRQRFYQVLTRTFRDWMPVMLADGVARMLY